MQLSVESEKFSSNVCYIYCTSLTKAFMVMVAPHSRKNFHALLNLFGYIIQTFRHFDLTILYTIIRQIWSNIFQNSIPIQPHLKILVPNVFVVFLVCSTFDTQIYLSLIISFPRCLRRTCPLRLGVPLIIGRNGDFVH